ncbi:MAG TPA: cytochrome c [Spongiibacteraceae bacterium]
MQLKSILIAAGMVISASGVLAQQKPEDAIKNRQATFNVIASHVGKIKASLDGEYNRDQVLKSTAVIQAIANFGIDSLFVEGTDKGTGYHETQLKTDAFNPDNAKKFEDAVNNFADQANQLAVIANIGDKAAVQAQFGKLRGTCKSCHDNFRNDSTAK